jgi:hypothetical protein
MTNDLEFEKLLRNRQIVQSDIKIRKEQPKPLKAEKNATMEDFISMVAMITSKALKKHNVVFIPDEGAIISDPQKKLEKTTILYQVISRVPHMELKARPLETIIEDIDDEGNRRFGQNWSQRQDCVIQFDVVACDYATANEVMSTFEDTIFTYTGYFKSKGVAELYFKKYYTDKNLDKYRQWLSVRSIQYNLIIEKLVTVFDTTIKDIDA